MSIRNLLSGAANKAGTVDPNTGAMHTTPWAWRTNDGIYVGHNKEVWLYRQLQVAPMLWEDPAVKLQTSSPLASLLYELGETSKDLGTGLSSMSRSREIHLLALTWETHAQVPDGTPQQLADFMESMLQYVIPAKALLIGVRLWGSSAVSPQGLWGTAKALAAGTATKQLGETTPKLDVYHSDIKTVVDILHRNGASKIPDKEARSQLEAWYSQGRTTDATMYATRDMLFVDGGDRIEMAAVVAFESPSMQAPDAPWAMSAQIHPAGAHIISVRGQIDPSTVARRRVRRSQRKVLAQMEEEAATGDLERPEHSITFNLAQEVERFILTGREPLISNCSILMGRRVSSGYTDTYIDELRSVYGIDMKPLEHRHLLALDETLPTSSRRANPFVQDVSVAMLAYAGMQAFSNLGDQRGVFTGLVDPDYVPCFLDPLGAPADNKPPAMLIAGDPGSGKTFLAQLICVQTALAGIRTIFINPKSDDSLEGLAELTGGDIIKLSDVEDQGGFFDPFRYCEQTPQGRQIAADILGQHILTVLGARGVAGQGFTQEQEIAVSSGLRTAAVHGARFAKEAIDHIEDPAVKDLIMRQAMDPLFRLGIGMAEQSMLQTGGKLLLVEFDKPLDIPEKGVRPSDYTRTQRLAIAAVRLVTRASMEILGASGGGVMVLDEAWMYLQSSDGMAAVQSFGRLGRSKNLLPIFATQRVDDLLHGDANMEGYLSRVWAMKLTDPTEARAALRLCELEATPERIEWLANAGHQRAESGRPGRPAMALHRDLRGRRSAVLIGPIPEHIRMALSTNPEDRKARRARTGS